MVVDVDVFVAAMPVSTSWYCCCCCCCCGRVCGNVASIHEGSAETPSFGSSMGRVAEDINQRGEAGVVVVVVISMGSSCSFGRIPPNS